MYYVNKYGLILEALQWDGSEESIEKIKKYFRVKGNRTLTGYHLETQDNLFVCIINKDDYIFREPVKGYIRNCLPKAFEKLFSPVSDICITLIDKITKKIMRKFQTEGEELKNELEKAAPRLPHIHSRDTTDDILIRVDNTEELKNELEKAAPRLPHIHSRVMPKWEEPKNELEKAAPMLPHIYSRDTTDDILIRVDNTAAPRSVIISTEDITDIGRIFVIKDESGRAGTNHITVKGESGTINGKSEVIIYQNYGSLIIYTDGTNLFTFK